MKRLFMAFLLIGFFANLSAWGEDKTPTDITQSMSKDTSFVAKVYNELNSMTYRICKDLMNGAYSSIRTIFNNVISILLGLIAFFWLFKHLKTGTISREEVFKALIFIIVFVIVYVLFNSQGAYNEFKNLFNIPQKIVKAALSSAIGISDVGEAMNYAMTKPILLTFDLIPKSFWNFVETHDWYKFQYVVAPSFTSIVLIVYAIYLIFLTIVVISVIIMILYSTFLSCIYLIFLPITIPLLLIPQTKGIFFACVKSYIGITMYVPLTFIPISIINTTTKSMTTDSNILLGSLLFYTLLGIITCIIAIMLLKKIPSWINELLGVADQGVGMGGAIGMLKTAGMGVGAAAMGAGKALVSSMSGKSTAGKIGMGLANIATGGMASMGVGAAKGIGGLIKNGFKAMGNHFSGKTK